MAHPILKTLAYALGGNSIEVAFLEYAINYDRVRGLDFCGEGCGEVQSALCWQAWFAEMGTYQPYWRADVELGCRGVVVGEIAIMVDRDVCVQVARW